MGMNQEEVKLGMTVEVTGPNGGDREWEDLPPGIHALKWSTATIDAKMGGYFKLRFADAEQNKTASSYAFKSSWFSFRADPKVIDYMKFPFKCKFKIGDVVKAIKKFEPPESEKCPSFAPGMGKTVDREREVKAVYFHWYIPGDVPSEYRDVAGQEKNGVTCERCDEHGQKKDTKEGHYNIRLSDGYYYREEWLKFANEEEETEEDDSDSEGSDDNSSDSEEKEGSGNMAEDKKKMAKDVEIVRTGEKIIVPPGMKLSEAREWLERKEKEEERTVTVREVIDGFPLDAAHALSIALAKKYGWVDHIPTPGFFGDTPPQMLAVEVGIGKTHQVPWGRLSIPKWEGGFVQTSLEPIPGGNLPRFVLVGNMKKKWAPEVEDIAAITREVLKANSIYRGKALRVKLPEPNEEFDPRIAPKFIPTDVDPNNLIFPDDVMYAIQDSLFSIIQGTEAARADKVPLKRGILFAGPYGVGKTMTSGVTARYCVENGWTFILLDNITQLASAMAFARQYQPAVLFAEDIDSVVRGERSQDMNDILNTIDGVDSKGSEVVVVLSTNHVEKINKAMLRPGRIDALIEVRPPDAKAALRLVRVYSGSLLDTEAAHFDSDMNTLGMKLAGKIPAVIREIVERSKMSSISRWIMAGKPEGPRKINPTDLNRSADSMKPHLKLMEPAPEPVHPLAIFGGSVGAAIGAGVMKAVEKTMKDNGSKVDAEMFSGMTLDAEKSDKN